MANICERNSDNCTLTATTTRNTSDGWLQPEHMCESCAKDYDHWLANYDPPDPDGEAFRGNEAAGYQCEQMLTAQRLKR